MKNIISLAWLKPLLLGLFMISSACLFAQKLPKTGFVAEITPTGGNGETIITGGGTSSLNFNIPTESSIRIQFEAKRNSGAPTLELEIDGFKLIHEELNSTTYQEFISAPLNVSNGTYSLDISNIAGGNLAIRNIKVQRMRRWEVANDWQNNTLPVSGDEILIPDNAAIALGDANIQIENLTIEGHLQHCLNQNTTMASKFIFVKGVNGLFQAGKAGAPCLGNLEITLVGTNDGNNGGHGNKYIVAGMGGTLELHGEPKKSWSQLGQTVNAGSNQITMKEPLTWEVGDVILICPTRLNWNEGEKRTITSVSADKRTFGLNQNLAFPHSGFTKTYTRFTDGKSWDVDIRAEVGLLSRNIKIQGDASSDGDNYGGHIMIHSTGHGYADGIELYRMGQTGVLARYPWHWHLMEDKAQGQYIRNSAIHKSYSRAVTIHGTESVFVEGNFCYDHIGHGIFLEDGSERFNTIRNNVVLLSKRPAAGDELTPSDNQLNQVQNRTPSSYWITNPNNIFEGNVAAGTQGTGFWFSMPRSPMGFSASIPRFNGMEPYKEPLGSFSGNKSHSCKSGFDIFDQLSATHALLRNRGWIRTDNRYIDAHTFYACDLANYSGIGEGRRYTESVIFRNNIYIDNVTSLMHASYATIEQSLFVSNSGENVFNGERKLNRGYDGACTLRNCHLVGWQDANANYVQNTGGAQKHVNYRISGMTSEPYGPPRMNFPNYASTPNGNVGANSVHHPRFWSYVHWDQDGSFSHKPNTSIITNHPLCRDGSEERFVNWTNLYRTDHRFAYLLIDAPGDPRLTIVRTKSGTPKAGQYYINGFYGTFVHFPVIVNDGFLYTVQFESLGSGKSVRFHMKDDYVAGDEVLYRIKNFAQLPGVVIGNATEVGSLAQVQSHGGNAWAKVGDDVYLKMVAISSTPDISCNITWNTNITLPVLDTDGDGITDLQESINGTDPIPNGTIPTNPALPIPTIKTTWHFNQNGNSEGWTTNGTVTSNVSGGNNNLSVTGSDPQIRSATQLAINANEYKFLRFRLESDSDGMLEIFWGTYSNQNYSGARRMSLPIENTNGEVKEFIIDMSTHPEWLWGLYRLRVDPEVGVGGNVKFDLISLEKENKLDCNREWEGTASIDLCSVCSAGSTGITPNSTCADCNGDPNGTANIDVCGVCSGGNTGIAADECTQCNTVVTSSDDGNVGANTLDDDLNTRWSAFGVGETIEYCLDDTISIEAIQIAFFKGDERASMFDVQYSLDGINWNNLLTNQTSSGTSLLKENFSFSDTDVWKLKIIGKGNTQHDWNSFTEVSWVATPIDCNGDLNGTAGVDQCGVCSGGNTGVTPNSTCRDCNNEVNGTASVDQCGVCSGGNTGVTPNSTCRDCNNEINGTASVDQCGVCSGGSTGVIPNSTCRDCNNEVNGSASVDQCGVCSGGSTGISIDDCLTSINKSNINKSINIYPNPTEGIVYFDTKVDYSVLNSLGVVIESGSGDMVDLSSYATGLYFISINNQVYSVMKE